MLPKRPSFGGHPVWVPNTNVFISDADELILQVELCGMRSENLEITVEGHRLQVAGNRPNAEFEAATSVLVHEMHCGDFESVLELPSEYDLSRATACYLNGVLRIAIPKKDSQPPPPITLE